MADHALATVDNPSSALTDFTLIVDLSDMPAAWWNAINTTDFTRGRGYKGDGTTRLACDWIDPVNNDDGTGTGLLRVKWSGTLATTGTQQLWIEPPLAANATVAANDTYGSDNAYDSSWEGYWPDGGGTDRTVNGYDGTANGGVTFGGVAGLLGDATDYDGSDDYSSLGTATIVDGTSNCSIIAAVNVDTAAGGGNQRGLYSRRSGSDNGMFQVAIGTFSGSDTQVTVTTNDGSYNDHIATTGTGTGSWAHIAAVVDSTTMRHYLNGATNGTNTYTDPSAQTGKAQQIGSGTGTSFIFDGKVQHISAHSVARPAAWISHEYDQTSDNSTFWGTWTWTSGGSGTTVSVSALDHTHTLDTVSITQTQNIGVADSYHAHALDTVVIQQINNIEIASMFHAGELDTVTLTQTHSIGIGDLYHANVLDDTGITQRHNISVDELSHAHELDTVAVTIGEQITAIADDLYHAHVLDGVEVTQRQNVTVADLYHDHVVDGASLSPRVTVSIDDLTHTHALDGVGYTQAHVIVVDDLSHEQSQGTVSLTQRHFLTIQDLVQAHGLDAVNFTIAEGIVTLTFTDKSGSAVFTGKTGSATFTDKTGRIVWTQ